VRADRLRSAHRPIRLCYAHRLIAIDLIAIVFRSTMISTLLSIANDVCPESAAFFGFMGVASALVFASKCFMDCELFHALRSLRLDALFWPDNL
jgi:hypothetical protein